MNKKKRCGNCGSRNTKIEQTIGPFPWRDFPKVLLDSPISATKCQDCGEILSKLGEARALDRKIEATIKAHNLKHIIAILEKNSLSQIQLAELVGVTPEYLSEMKRGAKIPRYMLFNYMRVLALSEQAYDLACTDLGATG